MDNSTGDHETTTHYDGSLPQALALMWDVCDRLRFGTETVALDETALGRVAAETVRAPAPLPAHPIALRDGHALVAATAATTPPAAWHPVTTRAPLPPGTDCVVPAEWPASVAAARARPGLFVGAPGSLVARGAVLLAAGARVTPSTLALLRQALPASPSSPPTIAVARAPVLGLLTVCDDDEAETAAPGPAALVAGVLARARLGVRTVDCGTAPATRDAGALRAALLGALTSEAEPVDGLVCLGGAWGAAPVLRALAGLPGAVWTEHFRHTRLGPGKPTTFGTLRTAWASTVPVWVLGGSAEAAECGAYAAVVPGVEALLGLAPPRTMFGASTRVARLCLAPGVHCAGKGAPDDAAWVQLVPVVALLREGLVTRVLARRSAAEGGGGGTRTDTGEKKEEDEGSLVALAHKTGLLVIPLGVVGYGPGDCATVIITE